MTPEDKKRVEEIRNYCNTLARSYVPDMKFLLAQLDEAHAPLRFYGDVLQVRCRMKEHDNGERARKALGEE